MRRMTHKTGRALLCTALLAAHVPAGAADPVFTDDGTTITEGDVTIRADRVTRPDGGGIMLHRADLTRDGRDGSIRIRSLFLADIALIAALSSSCAETPVSGEAIARGVRFNPDPGGDVPGARNAEGVEISLASLDLSVSGCERSVEGPMDGIVITGVDGSSLSIDSADTSLSVDGEDGAIRTRTDVSGVRLLDAEGGATGFRFAEAGVSFHGRRGDVGGVLGDLSERDLPGLLDRLSRADAGFGGYFRGLDMVPARFFPEDDRERLGLDGVDRISGSAEMSGGAAVGHVRFTARADLDELLRGETHLRFRTPSGEGMTLPAAVTDRLPVPSDLLGLTLERISVSYEDLGAGRVIREATGRTPLDILSDAGSERVERAADRLPGGFGPALRAAWSAVEDMIDQGGKVGMEPAPPVTLMEAGISGLGGADALAKRLGAYKKDNMTP